MADQRNLPLGPLISPVLMAELVRRFPNQVPEIDTPDREVWAAVGVQRLISFLQRQYDGDSGDA